MDLASRCFRCGDFKTFSSITDEPSDGTTYVANNTVGSATVVYVGTSTSFVDSGLTNDTTIQFIVTIQTINTVTVLKYLVNLKEVRINIESAWGNTVVV